MTLSEVQKLVDAGFTREEILAFENPQNPQIFTQAENTNVPENKQENHSENTAPAVDDPAENAPDRSPGGTENTNIIENPVLSELNKNISQLIKTIQKSNLAVNSIDKPTEVDLNKKVDSIMQSIIRSSKEV